jgi:hypothetical protein
MSVKDIPIVTCEHVSSKGDVHTWRFWCPYCRRHHLHGGEPDANGEIGHRSAHCHVPTSQYRARGYFLRASTKVTA